MSKKKLWILLSFVAVAAFFTGYATTAKAWHSNWYGYFFETYDTSGLEVLPPWGGPTGTPYGNCQGDGWALPGWVSTPSEFTNFIKCKLYGNTQSRRGAAFIISTMSGMKNVNPGSAELNEFTARVNYAASQGWINFGASVGCILPNTYYQDAGSGDVAHYSGCGSGSGAAITFWNGSDYYIIKRFCANPVGNMPPLHDDQNFTISGFTTITNSTNSARGANPFPGDSLVFHHYIRNNGPTSTSPTSIWAVAERTQPGPVATVAGAGNFGVLGVGAQPNVYNVTVNIPAGTAPGTRFCERVGYDPVNAVGGRNGRGAEACATVAYNFSLTPSINAVITSSSGPIAGNIAEPGDTIAFTYAVNNTGTTVSQNVTCTYRQATYTGYNQTAPATGFTPGGANCAPTRTFPYGANTTIATEPSVAASPTNRSICRSLTITPTTASGGTQTVQSCVFVTSKPYFRVYGGDLAAGGAVAPASTPNTCNRNTGAAIIGWNKRSPAGAPADSIYAGAGVQFAALAMSTIFDTASALGAGSGPPASLSFRNNNTSVANGRFGGAYLSAPCITDYYATRPASPPGFTSGTALPSTGSGTYNYAATGNIRLLASTIDPGAKVNLYVSGNLYIDGNITYGGSGTWSSGNIPMLRIIVSGNIFVDNDVTRLDGLYVAQQSTAASNDGIIYTCTSGTAPGPYAPPTLGVGGTLSTMCDAKLTVNGSFIARQVWLLRTLDTLRNSTNSENAASGHMTEVFNYGPALWMSQPSDNTGAADYDAINSLPPVL